MRTKVPPTMRAAALDRFGGPKVLTLHVLPAALQSDAMRASWMAYLGCEAQAEALLRRTR